MENRENLKRNKNENVIMNFSGIYNEQQFYRNRTRMKNISWVEVQDLPGSNCYCDDEARKQILEKWIDIREKAYILLIQGITIM